MQLMGRVGVEEEKKVKSQTFLSRSWKKKQKEEAGTFSIAPR